MTFASSSSIYGDAAAYPTPEDTIPHPLAPYGITKLACEHLAHAYASSSASRSSPCGTSRSTARASVRTWPSRRWSPALAEGRPFELYGDGSQSRSFTYVDDAVEATIAAMERGTPGSTFNVGGGTEVSMLEAIETLGRIAKRRLEVVRMPRREGDAARTAADTTRIREALGWEPVTPFDEGLEAQWRWAADRVAAA